MDEKELMRRRVEGWEELEAIKRRELEALTDDDVRKIIARLLATPVPPQLPPRTGSGLVEQQRRFAKLRERG